MGKAKEMFRSSLPQGGLQETYGERHEEHQRDKRGSRQQARMGAEAGMAHWSRVNRPCRSKWPSFLSLVPSLFLSLPLYSSYYQSKIYEGLEALDIPCISI